MASRADPTGAFGSDDGEYRYCLWRRWDVERPTVTFVMLNPSTADETEDDPTIRRCLGYARDWGFGTLLVGNLFALRATDPAVLNHHPAPIGPENDDHLRSLTADAERVIVAWGSNGSLRGRDRAVISLLEVPVYALGTTTDGQPVHPLYRPADAEPERYDPSN